MQNGLEHFLSCNLNVLSLKNTIDVKGKKKKSAGSQ